MAATYRGKGRMETQGREMEWKARKGKEGEGKGEGPVGIKFSGSLHHQI